MSYWSKARFSDWEPVTFLGNTWPALFMRTARDRIAPAGTDAALGRAALMSRALTTFAQE
jgi:hypothetical protein